MLAEHAEGLIALTGGPGGPLNTLLLDGQHEAAVGAAGPVWPRCSATGSMSNCSVMAWPEERATEDALLDLAYAKDLPLVATNDVHFGEADMYEAHDALLCIADGAFVSQDDRRRLTREHRFKTRGRNGGAIRRSARGDREHASRSRGAAPSGPAKRNPILPRIRAGVRPRAGRGIEGPGGRGPDAPPGGARAGGRRESLSTSGWTMSSASSTAWAFPATS